MNKRLQRDSPEHNRSRRCTKTRNEDDPTFFTTKIKQFNLEIQSEGQPLDSSCSKSIGYRQIVEQCQVCSAEFVYFLQWSRNKTTKKNQFREDLSWAVSSSGLMRCGSLRENLPTSSFYFFFTWRTLKCGSNVYIRLLMIQF